jgi:pilus assembly protein Flp/PilA
MNWTIQKIRNLFGLKTEEQGATMVEYGLMVALIAVVCLATVTTLGVNLKGIFTQISTAL